MQTKDVIEVAHKEICKQLIYSDQSSFVKSNWLRIYLSNLMKGVDAVPDPANTRKFAKMFSEASKPQNRDFFIYVLACAHQAGAEDKAFYEYLNESETIKSYIDGRLFS